ncbi:MAG TPA: class IV adenylate cyclase [Gemmataceae bacterium]|nr:class IV adenylate cyclase [Gemmataceae bacterium]
MLEVEMKFAGVDFGPMERRLAEWGARPGPLLQEADHYFNAPDRDFAQTDEALRLRRVGPANFVTYKGPKRDLQTKTRTEVEVPLAEGDRAAEDFIRLLTHLGYRPVAVVRKRRRIFHLERAGFPVAVSLDEVEGLGRFVELEVQASEKRMAAARAAVQKLAAELGLTASERRSYLELLLAADSKGDAVPSRTARRKDRHDSPRRRHR